MIDQFKVYAKFYGWQDRLNDTPLPLFIIYGPHPLEGSAVSTDTLLANNIPVVGDEEVKP